jgi:hypothetical protein
MTLFRVIWEIDIDAETPEDAAKQALGIQRDRDSNGTIFDCIDEYGNAHRIDVTELEQQELVI